MYESHFGLCSRPFRAGPDASAYFPATSHEAAIRALQETVLHDEGLCLLYGDAGVGKTLICQCLLERLGSDVKSAYVTHCNFTTAAALLQAVLFDLSQPYEGKTEQELRLGLAQVLLQNVSDGRRTVLVVDEAHNLPAVCLEELRLLVNLEAGSRRAVCIVLSAQPDILTTLENPSLSAFNQRLALRVHLESFTDREAAECLWHQLRVAGAGDRELFTEEAVEIIAAVCRGVPRTLGKLAQQAMMLAHDAGCNVVDVEAVTEAQSMLEIETPEVVANPGFPALVADAGDDSTVTATPPRRKGRRRSVKATERKRRSA